MENLLDLHTEAAGPLPPVKCFDERPCQLTEETRVPRPVAPGQAARAHYACECQSTANLFVMVHR